MLVDFGLVTKMDMLVGTVGTGMFVRVTRGVSYVLMLVCMFMAMDVLMFMRMDLAPMGVLVGMTVYMLMAMFMAVFMAVFVRPFHFCLLLSEPHYRLFRC